MTFTPDSQSHTDRSWRDGETVGEHFDRLNRAAVLAPLEAEIARLRAEIEALREARDDQRRRLEPDGAGGFRWEAADLDVTVTRLRAANENYERCLHATEEKAAALRAENERLRRYARHTDRCALVRSIAVDNTPRAACSCGFAGASDEDGASA